MDKDHPFLLFSNKMVAARKQNNHNGYMDKVEEDSKEIELTGIKIAIKRIQKIIKKVKKTKNK